MADKQPRCACKKGYVPHETYGCVDESPPHLTLKHDPSRDGTLRLKQGDFYKEYAVEIKDENAEEYLRSLKIAYSWPLPNGCLSKMGEFNVNYTVETPWTIPPFQRVTRRVVIDDIDECSLDVAKYERLCPSLVPRCDTAAGAKCVNTKGSYTCRCPKHTTGDGFLKGVAFDKSNPPVGFHGGQSCHDTGKPVIQLQGPNPKVFRVCGCGGINGIMNQKVEEDTALKTSQQSHYESDILVCISRFDAASLTRTTSNSIWCKLLEGQSFARLTPTRLPMLAIVPSPTTRPTKAASIFRNKLSLVDRCANLPHDGQYPTTSRMKPAMKPRLCGEMFWSKKWI